MDGYPEFTREQMDWFVALVEAIVPEYPDDVINVGRHKDGLDLELELYIEPRSRSAFTAEVRIQLAEQAAEHAGVLKAVVYVHGSRQRFSG